VGVAHGAYPSTYPVEKGDAIPDLPDILPSLTFDADDSGGYVYKYDIIFDMMDSDFEAGGTQARGDAEESKGAGFAWCPNGHCQHLLVAGYGAPSSLDWQTWNCTGDGSGNAEGLWNTFFSDADYTGIANGDTICAPGDCCTQYVGHVKFSSDQMEWHSWFDNLLSSNGCGTPHEEFYCSSVTGHAQTNCHEVVPNQDDRLWMYHCYDLAFLFISECPVIAATGYNTGMVAEPAGYMDQLSMSQNIIIGSVMFAPDRVCMPYSYYYPSSSSSSTTASSSSSTTTSSPGSALQFTAAAMLAIVLA